MCFLNHFPNLTFITAKSKYQTKLSPFAASLLVLKGRARAGASHRGHDKERVDRPSPWAWRSGNYLLKEYIAGLGIFDMDKCFIIHSFVPYVKLLSKLDLFFYFLMANIVVTGNCFKN